MKLDRSPQLGAFNRLAIMVALAGAPACAGQAPQPEEPKEEVTVRRKPLCDPTKPGNYEVISDEPMKTVYRVCDNIYVAQTIRGVSSAKARSGVVEAQRTVVTSTAAQSVVDEVMDGGVEEADGGQQEVEKDGKEDATSEKSLEEYCEELRKKGKFCGGLVGGPF